MESESLGVCFPPSLLAWSLEIQMTLPCQLPDHPGPHFIPFEVGIVTGPPQREGEAVGPPSLVPLLGCPWDLGRDGPDQARN